jgi:hypothetical protein
MVNNRDSFDLQTVSRSSAERAFSNHPQLTSATLVSCNSYQMLLSPVGGVSGHETTVARVNHFSACDLAKAVTLDLRIP